MQLQFLEELAYINCQVSWILIETIILFWSVIFERPVETTERHRLGDMLEFD